VSFESGDLLVPGCGARVMKLLHALHEHLKILLNVLQSGLLNLLLIRAGASIDENHAWPFGS
jgi:hypothetical protein